MAPNFDELAAKIAKRVEDKLSVASDKPEHDIDDVLEVMHDILVSELSRVYTLGLLSAYDKEAGDY